MEGIEGIEGFVSMDMVGMGVEGGCSETRVGESIGGDVTFTEAGLGASVDGRGEVVLDCVSFVARVSSSLLDVVAAVSSSPGLTSGSVVFFSAALDVLGAGCAGLSGREPKSDDGLESVFSAPLFTAFASRSCSLELGLLRDEFREAFMPSAGFLAVSHSITHLAPRPVSCPRLPFQAHPACLCLRPVSDSLSSGSLR